MRLDALIERQANDIERGKKVVGVIGSSQHQILLCLIHVLRVARPLCLTSDDRQTSDKRERKKEAGREKGKKVEREHTRRLLLVWWFNQLMMIVLISARCRSKRRNWDKKKLG
jgi:hypothetical protein